MHIPVQKWCGRTKLNWMYLWLDEKRWCMPSLPHCIKQMIKKLFVYSQTCWRSGGKENNPLFSVFQVNPCVQMLLFSSVHNHNFLLNKPYLSRGLNLSRGSNSLNSASGYNNMRIWKFEFVVKTQFLEYFKNLENYSKVKKYYKI